MEKYRKLLNVDYVKGRYIDLNRKGNLYLSLAQAQYQSIMYNRNNFTVWSVMGTIEDRYRQQMFMYNHLTDELHQEDWGTWVEGDYHSSSTVLILEDGTIITFSDAKHDTYTIVKRSLNPYDISSFEIISEIRFLGVTYVSPILFKNKIYCLTRGNGVNSNFLVQSEDNGLTWSTELKLNLLDGWAYPRLVFSESKLRLIISERLNNSSNYNNVYYMESDDGLNWGNIDGSYFNNVNSGYVSIADMKSFYLVGEHGYVGSTCEIDHDNIMFYTENNGGKIIYSENGAWKSIRPEHSQIIATSSGGRGGIIKVEDGFSLICNATLVNGKEAIIQLITKDYFKTSILEIIDYNITTSLVSHNYNATKQSILAGVTDNTFSGVGTDVEPLNSYSNIKIFKDILNYGNKKVVGDVSISLKTKYDRTIEGYISTKDNIHNLKEFHIYNNGVFKEIVNQHYFSISRLQALANIKIKAFDVNLNESSFSNVLSEMPIVTGSFKLADDYSNSEIAISIVKISSSYSGYCMKIRRASDNALLDVGFVNEVVDTDAITTFCGASYGYLHTWYDQSGNNQDFINAVTTQQALIKNDNLILKNGFLSPYFNGASKYPSVNHILNSTFTILTNIVKTTTAGGTILGTVRWSSIAAEHFNFTSEAIDLIFRTNGVTDARIGVLVDSTKVRIAGVVGNNGVSKAFDETVFGTEQLNSEDVFTKTTYLGSNSTDRLFIGNISQVLVYGTNHSDIDIANIIADNKTNFEL